MSRWPEVVVGLAAAVSAALVILATRVGPGISPDSTVYLSTGLHLAETGRLVNFDGERLALFPPGMPVVVAALDVVGLDPLTGLRVVNAVAAAAAVVLTYRLVCRVWPAASGPAASRWPAAAAAVVVGLSTGTVQVFSWAWSEPLFCVLVLAALLLLVNGYVAGGFSPGRAVAFCALAATATSLRWVGVVLAPTAMVILLIAAASTSRGDGRTRRLMGALLVGGGAAAAFVGLVAANISAGDAAMGPRLPSMATAGRVLTDIVLTPGQWVLNGDPTKPSALVIDVAVISLAAAGSVLAIRAAVSGVGTERAALPMVVWCGFYWGILVYSELRTVVDPIEVRLSSPVAVPTLVLVLLGGRALLQGLPTLARPLGMVSAAALVAVMATSSVLQAAVWSKQGIGLAAVALEEALGPPARRSVEGASLVVSDQPWLAWWLTQVRPVRPTSDIFYYRMGRDQRTRAAALARDVAASDRAVVLLLDSDADDRADTIRGLRESGLEVSMVDGADDYAVFRVVAG